jgi:hypothetical protein
VRAVNKKKREKRKKKVPIGRNRRDRSTKNSNNLLYSPYYKMTSTKQHFDSLLLARAYIFWNFTTQRSRSGFPRSFFFSFPFFLVVVDYRILYNTDIDSYLCGFGFISFRGCLV